MQVKIGPNFFAKEFSAYSDWIWAFIREAMQNSIDAPGSDTINFTICEDGGNTVVTWDNNGETMTKEIIVDKLLALGESGKCFNGFVGGFGKAKIILYLSHQSYVIRTGEFEVTGVGGDFEIAEGLSHYAGTRSVVIVAGNHVDSLTRAVKRFTNYAQWGGSLWLNGEQLVTDLRKGSPRRDLGFGVCYSNRSFQNRLIVRINGIPMFDEYVSFDRCVIVELNGVSSDVLTANRDGLVSKYRYELSALITELAVDKKSALKNRGKSRYRIYDGQRLNYCKLVEKPVFTVVEKIEKLVGFAEGIVGLDAVSKILELPANAALVKICELIGDAKVEEELPYAADVRSITSETVKFDKFFVIKNETDLKVPSYYLPDSDNFSSHNLKLVSIWGKLIWVCHQLFSHEAEFGIGFVFDESLIAEFESGVRGKIYYINPAMVVERGGSRGFKKRFKLTDRNLLISIALHEFVHGLGFSNHDEIYAGKFTEMMAVALDNRSKFNWCFA